MEYELIDTYEKARERGFSGLPTLLVDGVDPFAALIGLVFDQGFEEGVGSKGAGARLVSVLLVVWAVRALSHNGHNVNRAGSNRALEILEERYALGEIDRDEFEERRSTMESPWR